MRIGLPLLPLLLCQAAMAHFGRPPDSAAPRMAAAQDRTGIHPVPMSAGSRKQGSRLLLEFRHRELRNRLDSLWNDTLRVAPKELPRFRRALRTADKVMAEAGTRIDELRRLDPAVENRKWETLRARTERTLFGLDRYLEDAEGYWLPVRDSISPPATGTGEDL